MAQKMIALACDTPNTSAAANRSGRRKRMGGAGSGDGPV
jgi:hypothetical protein